MAKELLTHKDIPPEVAALIQRAGTADDLLEAVLQWFHATGGQGQRWKWAHNRDGGGVMIDVDDDHPWFAVEEVPPCLQAEMTGVRMIKIAGGVEAQTMLQELIGLAAEGDTLWVSAFTFDRIEDVCDPLIEATDRQVRVHFVADYGEAMYGKTENMREPWRKWRSAELQ